MMVLTLAQAATAEPESAYFLWGAILCGIALALLLLEFIVPSGGLIAILCGVCAVGSVVAFFMYSTLAGAIATITYVVATPILLVFLFKMWLHSPIARKMILGGEDQTATMDAEEATMASEQARLKRLAELKQLIGAEGVAETDLRPVGTVRINGQRVDAMAEAGVVDINTPVIVTDVYDNQIKVRPV